MIDSDNNQDNIDEDQEQEQESNNNNFDQMQFNQKPKSLNMNQFSLLNILSSTKYNYEKEKEIIFHNYIPKDESFKIERPNYFELISNTEKKIQKKVLKNIKNFIYLEKNPLNIIPNKNNIDLKRNVALRLQKLNKKTENAILELINEAIHKQKDTSKLANVSDQQFKKEIKELQQDLSDNDEDDDEAENNLNSNDI